MLILLEIFWLAGPSGFVPWSLARLHEVTHFTCIFNFFDELLYLSLFHFFVISIRGGFIMVMAGWWSQGSLAIIEIINFRRCSPYMLLRQNNNISIGKKVRGFLRGKRKWKIWIQTLSVYYHHKVQWSERLATLYAKPSFNQWFDQSIIKWSESSGPQCVRRLVLLTESLY